MARKKQTPASSADSPPMPSLLDALRFIQVAQAQAGPPVHRHCVLFGQWAYGFDGIISAGHRIEEDIAVAPLTVRLIQALERCDGQMALTLLPSGISVKSGRFRAVVPCFPLSDMPPIAPDPAVAPIDDRLRAAFAAVAPIVADNAQHIITAAVRLGPGTACATDRRILIEYWHGIDLPVCLIPKMAIKAIEAVKKPLAQFGYSGTSATFYFDDGSWVKTQLYEEKYPDIGRVLNRESDQWPVTPGLFDALKVMKPFVGDDKRILFAKNKLVTDANEAEGGTYDLEGLPPGRAFNIDYLLHLESLAKTVDYGKAMGLLLFFGDNVRGAIAPMADPRE